MKIEIYDGDGQADLYKEIACSSLLQEMVFLSFLSLCYQQFTMGHRLYNSVSTFARLLSSEVDGKLFREGGNDIVLLASLIDIYDMGRSVDVIVYHASLRWIDG